MISGGYHAPKACGENGRSSPCPFLLKNMACRIYDIRPFACRRIYSLERCHVNQSPVLHRQVMELSEKAIRTLQAMDETGYSGHLTFILHMLDTPAFLSTYTAGEFFPEAIMAYGKTHRIVINKFIGDVGD